jgi:hypothetical protein
MSNHPAELGYNSEIGKRVYSLRRNGVPVRTIFATVQTYQNAPKSMRDFYKYYRLDMERAVALTAEEIGGKVVNQAINGDDEAPNTWKAREFYLRTQADWSPKTIEETREIGTDEEEAESAVNALLKALGKDTGDDV